MRPNAARHSQRTRRTTKIHKGRRRKRNRRFHRFGQIWGRLPPAGRAMEAWKFGGLEVWLFPHDGLSRRPAPLHAPFSVFRSPGRVSAPCPICPTATSFGTSQTCRGCRGNWKLGSLEAWLFRWGSAILPSSPQRGASYISYTPFARNVHRTVTCAAKAAATSSFPRCPSATRMTSVSSAPSSISSVKPFAAKKLKAKTVAVRLLPSKNG